MEIMKFYSIFNKAYQAFKKSSFKRKEVSGRIWKVKEEKRLLDHVKHIYFQMKKFRINVVKFDPSKKRKRVKK